MAVSVRGNLIRAFLHEIPVRIQCRITNGEHRTRHGTLARLDFTKGLVDIEDIDKGYRSQKIRLIESVELLGRPQRQLSAAERQALKAYLDALAKAGKHFTPEELARISE